MIVSMKSLRSQIRLMAFQEDGKRYVEEHPNITIIEAHYFVNIYPVLAACTQCEDGPVPTAEEFMATEDVDGANTWYMAALEINPEAFPKTLEVPTEEAEESKKKRKRRR